MCTFQSITTDHCAAPSLLAPSTSIICGRVRLHASRFLRCDDKHSPKLHKLFHEELHKTSCWFVNSARLAAPFTCCECMWMRSPQHNQQRARPADHSHSMPTGHTNDASRGVCISPHNRAQDEGAAAIVTSDLPDGTDASVDSTIASNDNAMPCAGIDVDDGEAPLETEKEDTLLPGQSHTTESHIDVNPLATLKARLYDLKWHVPRYVVNMRVSFLTHSRCEGSACVCPIAEP